MWKGRGMQRQLDQRVFDGQRGFDVYPAELVSGRYGRWGYTSRAIHTPTIVGRKRCVRWVVRRTGCVRCIDVSSQKHAYLNKVGTDSATPYAS